MPDQQQFVNASNHAVPLASGQVLAPGEKGPSDMKHYTDKANRDAGLLVKADDDKEKKA